MSNAGVATSINPLGIVSPSSVSGSSESAADGLANVICSNLFEAVASDMAFVLYGSVLLD